MPFYRSESRHASAAFYFSCRWGNDKRGVLFQDLCCNLFTCLLQRHYTLQLWKFTSTNSASGMVSLPPKHPTTPGQGSGPQGLAFQEPDTRQHFFVFFEDIHTTLTQCTWISANSRRWWRTGKFGMLQSMGSRVGHYSATEQQQPLLLKQSELSTNYFIWNWQKSAPFS